MGQDIRFNDINVELIKQAGENKETREKLVRCVNCGVKNELPMVLRGDHDGVLEWLFRYNTLVRQEPFTYVEGLNLHLDRVVEAFDRADYTTHSMDMGVHSSDDKARHLIGNVFGCIFDGGHNMLSDEELQDHINLYRTLVNHKASETSEEAEMMLLDL